MPYKDPAVRKTKHKEYSAIHYQKNADAVREKSRTLRKQKRDAWLQYKAGLACHICGFSHPAVIDFHHPPGTKKYGVNDLISDGRFARAYKEAAKCIILCANCHRIHHYNEKGGR